ncbi:MAG: flagellar hook-length control protein FliK [Moraxellaceae bacterium]|nr:MAG: flagellar hook-length control protein FliK [Moraxellaceae bacterium]
MASGVNSKFPADGAAPEDFGRILQQQDNQQLRQKDDNKSSEGREPIKDKSKEPIGNSSSPKARSSEARELADSDKDYESKDKNANDESQLSAPINSDINNSAHEVSELNANIPWPFWMQQVQAVTTPNTDADANSPIVDGANVTLMSSSIPNALVAQINASTEQAIKVNGEAQLQDNKIGLIPNTKTFGASPNFATFDAPLNIQNSSDIDLNQVLLGKGLQISNIPAATPQDPAALTQLGAAANFKSLLEGATTQNPTQLLTVLTAEAPPHEVGPTTVAQDFKWAGQVETILYPANMSANENKSFFQLRFNQQTLATDLAEKTGWLIEHKLDTAHIQLDPPELGPITVKIHTHQDQVSVTFVVNNAQVKDAMDQTMQRLKDLLHEQGIELSHADVNGQRQQRDSQQEGAPSDTPADDFSEEELVTIGLPQTVSGVDHFV